MYRTNKPIADKYGNTYQEGVTVSGSMFSPRHLRSLLKDGSIIKANLKITVMLTTFNRPDCCYELTKRLKELYPCEIIVVDDHSSEKVNREFIDKYVYNNVNYGKKGWWKSINRLWGLALRTRADLYIMTVDDAMPNDDFFTEALRVWYGITDQNKIALHLANNGRKRNWTRFNRVEYNKDVYLTQTTEMSFLCLPEFIRYRIPKVNRSRWDINPLLGSGVGDALNNHWCKTRKIFGVKKSLLKPNPNADISQMNLEERSKNPWKTI